MSMSTASAAQSPVQERVGRKTRRESWFVLFLCCLAGFRILIYSLAFPFFTNIDEQVHFDLVLKYSQSHIPRGLELVLPKSAQYISFFGTLEYFNKPSQYPDGEIPPPAWMRGGEETMQRLLGEKYWWEQRKNYESSQPPIYYGTAALWWRLGEFFGIKQGYLLYWTRALNALAGALVVFIGYCAARIIFPSQLSARLGVPVLLAFIPQDAFYSIENDVFAPLTCGLAFLCVVRSLNVQKLGVFNYAVTGLAVASSYLTKISALPIVAVASVAVLARLLAQARSSLRGKRVLADGGVFIACAFIPIAAWALRTKLAFGDFTGSADKIRLLDWTPKPFSEWWHHPLFTPAGFWGFISELLASFWRGEFVWHKDLLAIPSIDLFYTFSSLLCIGVTTVATTRRWRLGSNPSVLFATFCVLSSVAFLALLSIQFDFGRCVNPSRAHPFFVSGRLISGALIPFAIIYIHGLSKLSEWTKRAWVLPVLIGAVVVVTTVSEIVINRPVFESAYNFFHLK